MLKIQEHLGLSEDEIINIIVLRLTWGHIGAQYGAELLQIDEAIQCLDPFDHKTVVKEQKDHKTRMLDRAPLVQNLRQRRVSIRQRREKEADAVAKAAIAEAKAKAKAAAKALGRRVAYAPRGPRVEPERPPWVGQQITQATAALFCPPGGHVWCGYTKDMWCGHYPPFSRVSCPFVPHGDVGACKRVLSMLWGQHAESKGLDFPDCCPFADKLVVGDAESSSDSEE